MSQTVFYQNDNDVALIQRGGTGGQTFEFHAFKGNSDGDHAATADVTVARLRSDSVARTKAGRLAKRIGGPVDLAFAGAAPWNDRYITTASPSEYHSTGYRFEKLT